MFPGSQDNRKTFFELVHCMLLNPSIVKLTKNPYDLDWDEAHRLEKKLSLTSPVLKIFYSLHFQLTKVIHNSIPHYLQVVYSIKQHLTFDVSDASTDSVAHQPLERNGHKSSEIGRLEKRGICLSKVYRIWWQQSSWIAMHRFVVLCFWRLFELVFCLILCV